MFLGIHFIPWLCDFFYKIHVCNGNRIIIPPRIRTDLIQYCHAEILQHKKINNTTLYMKDRFYWPNMSVDISIYIKKCFYIRNLFINLKKKI